MSQSARSITEDELRFIRDTWPGPLLVKCVMRAEECRRLVGLGIDGSVVSNHGGRQLDGVLAAIEALPEVVEAVDGAVEVFVDGGVRRGVDVVKALGLGARACLIERPYLFALAAGGEAGARRVLEMFRRDRQTMALLGCPSGADVDASAIAPRAGFGGRPSAGPTADPLGVLLTAPRG